ncbi:hypothetical protein [Actinophytocola sp.]|uniref:hypothetical protein n=1 Tax=Actinophytocola sp. TaxID=1872138 RepID=UPI002ED30C22
MAVKSCTACGNEELEPGFMSDEGAHPGFGRWIRGELQTGIFGGAKVYNKELFEVSAYRCTRCFHLELYAEKPGY